MGEGQDNKDEHKMLLTIAWVKYRCPKKEEETSPQRAAG